MKQDEKGGNAAYILLLLGCLAPAPASDDVLLLAAAGAAAAAGGAAAVLHITISTLFYDENGTPKYYFSFTRSHLYRIIAAPTCKIMCKWIVFPFFFFYCGFDAANERC